MAFSSSVSGAVVVGNKKRVWGTFTNTDTDAGGNITTGLTNIELSSVSITSHSGSTMPRVFENSTIAGVSTAGTLGIVTPNGVDGSWSVIGI